MNTYTVQPLPRHKKYTVSVPGSKSITNRALLLAALSKNKVTLKGVLFSDDSRYFLSSLKSLGFDIEINEADKIVSVVGCNGSIPKKEGTIYVGSAGTAARFLTCMCGLSDGEYTVNASKQMQARPMKPLMDCLISMGAKIEYLGQEGHLPVKIQGCKTNLLTNKVCLEISSSTQYLSAMLMCGLMCKAGLDIVITSEKKYGSYIEVTLRMIKEFMGKVSFDGEAYHIPKENSYSLDIYNIEPDVSAACYFFGIAALTASKVTVKNIKETSMQGDIQFLKVLENMGCHVVFRGLDVEVTGPNDKLKAVSVNMNNFSDQAMTLAAVAVFAEGATKITGIGHIRVQESDRLMAIVNELNKMGIMTEYGNDYIVIYPGNPKASLVDTYEDHRMAMAFTLPGLVVPGITINNPMCCKKTFENYFDIIEDLHREK